MDKWMDAKYNTLLDSASFRLALLAVGFGAWLGVGIGLLKIAG